MATFNRPYYIELNLSFNYQEIERQIEILFSTLYATGLSFKELTVKKNSETLPQKNGQQRKIQIAETFPHIWGKIFSNLTGLTV